MPEAYAAAEAERRTLAAANRNPGPEPDEGPEPEPVWFEGIAEGGTSFFPSSPFAVSTHWVDVQRERVLQAFAGTLKTDRARGSSSSAWSGGRPLATRTPRFTGLRPASAR